MQNKISELQGRIDNYKDEVLKKGGKIDLDDDQNHLLNRGETGVDIKDYNANKERRGFEYMLASTAIANGKLIIFR
jgi:hypothetical protein